MELFRTWFAILGPMGLSAILGVTTIYFMVFVKRGVQELSINVDGRLTALLESKKSESVALVAEALARGIAEGRALERAEQASGVTNEDLLVAVTKVQQTDPLAPAAATAAALVLVTAAQAAKEMVSAAPPAAV